MKRSRRGKYPINFALPSPNLESSSGDESLGEKENPRPHQRCRIHVHSRTNQLSDPDGRSVKALIDGIVEAGILRSDDAECVSEVSQSQEKVKGEEQTIVDIIWENS